MKCNLGMLVHLKYQSRQLIALSFDSSVCSRSLSIYCRLYGNRRHPVQQAIVTDENVKTIWLASSSMEPAK